VAGLKGRNYHSAATFSPNSGRSEVILFGGLDKSGDPLADTTVLRLGESINS
jgi:hypothetical protein